MVVPENWGSRAHHFGPENAAQHPAPRAEADPDATAAADREGPVFRGDLEIPVIDWRPYLERELDTQNAHRNPSLPGSASLSGSDGEAPAGPSRETCSNAPVGPRTWTEVLPGES